MTYTLKRPAQLLTFRESAIVLDIRHVLRSIGELVVSVHDLPPLIMAWQYFILACVPYEKRSSDIRCRFDQMVLIDLISSVSRHNRQVYPVTCEDIEI